jgi:hypothetical protein
VKKQIAAFNALGKLRRIGPDKEGSHLAMSEIQQRNGSTFGAVEDRLFDWVRFKDNSAILIAIRYDASL